MGKVSDAPAPTYNFCDEMVYRITMMYASGVTCSNLWLCSSSDIVRDSWEESEGSGDVLER
jgi:hypothetical protein